MGENLKTTSLNPNITGSYIEVYNQKAATVHTIFEQNKL